MDEQKKRAKDWFESLQAQLIETFERIEREATLPQYDKEPGTFVRKPWPHSGGGGGTMAILEGRVFERQE